jgi:hypothetical protein
MLSLVAASGNFLPCKGMLSLTEQGKKLPGAAENIHYRPK